MSASISILAEMWNLLNFDDLVKSGRALTDPQDIGIRSSIGIADGVGEIV